MNLFFLSPSKNSTSWKRMPSLASKDEQSQIKIMRTIVYRGGGGDRFSDRRISQKNLFGFRIWRIFYTDLRILLIQRIADLCSILARIVDLVWNLVRILGCDFIVELLADLNLDKRMVGSRILLQIRADRRICITPFTPPPSPPYSYRENPSESSIFVKSI